MRNIRSNSGQAVIEYVLVLVVVVGLILGAIYQFNSAIRVWSNAYFGDYLMCLMEAGELPTLGAQDENSICRELRPNFSLAAGEPLVGEGVGEGGQTGPSGASGAGGTAAQAPSGNADGSAIARTRSLGNRTGQASRFRSRAGGGSGDEEDEGDGISRESSANGAGAGEGFSNDEGGASRFAVRGDSAGRRPGRGRTAEEDGEAKRSKAKNVAQEAGQRSGPQLIPISRGPAESVEAPDIEEMGIGGFLRYLIIAAIIIALVIFIGGQILQVSKSMQ